MRPKTFSVFFILSLSFVIRRTTHQCLLKPREGRPIIFPTYRPDRAALTTARPSECCAAI